MSARPDPHGRWICNLCEQTGLDGLGGWQHHYISRHWRLERERLHLYAQPGTRYGGQS